MENQQNINEVQERIRQRGPTDLYFLDGYSFVTAYRKRNANGQYIRYLRCRHYGPFLSCKARAKTDENGHETLLKGHTHAADPAEQSKCEFLESLKRMVQQRPGTLRDIYGIAAALNPDAAVDVPYQRIESTMRRWRRDLSAYPPIPETLVALADILENPRYQRFSCFSGGSFFEGRVVNGEHSALIFGNSDFIARGFNNTSDIFVDATFRVVPNRPQCRQLLTIFGLTYGHALPLVHVLMESKTQNLYEAVIQFVQDRLLRGIEPQRIMVDFERALYQALKQKFPRAQIHGCFFHFCQAIFRKARALGLFRERENVEINRFLKKTYALALLPAESIVEGFQILRREINEHIQNDPIMDIFLEYLERQWLQRVGPQHLSLYQQKHRTNNIMESYHRRLNDRAAVAHPGIFTLLEIIIQVQEDASLELRQLERGHRVRRLARKADTVFHERLIEAWRNLNADIINVTQFLHQSSHFTENLHDIFDRWSEAEEEIIEVPLLIPNEIQPPPLINQPVAVQNELEIQPDGVFENPPPEAFEILEIEQLQIRRWQPAEDAIFVPDDDPHYMMCEICTQRKKRYCFSCGHTLCGFCCARIYNYGRNCPFCRQLIESEPIFLFGFA